MQDDCYIIAADGWVARTARILKTDKKGKTRGKGWTCDLVPKPYIVTRYFAKEQADIEARQAELEAITASLPELEEETAARMVFSVAWRRSTAWQSRPDSGKLGDKEARDEAAVLDWWLNLDAKMTELKRDFRQREAALDVLAYNKYPHLAEDGVRVFRANASKFCLTQQVVDFQMSSF